MLFNPEAIYLQGYSLQSYFLPQKSAILGQP